MLGNPPASLLVKHMPRFQPRTAEAPAWCGQFVADLLVHVTATAPPSALCLSEDSEDFSADDEDETMSIRDPFRVSRPF